MNRPAGVSRYAPLGKYLFQSALLALAYAAVAKWTLGQVFEVVGDSIVPVWPAGGLAVGILAVYGYRFFLGVIAGAVLISLPLTGTEDLFGIAGICGEALLSAFLLRRLSSRERWLGCMRDWGGLAFAAVAGAVVAATLGGIDRVLSGAIPWSEYDAAWLDHWFGDSLGILMAAPIVLSLSDRGRKLPDRRNLKDMVVIAATLIVFSYVVFSGFFPKGTAVSLLGGFFPFLLWMAFRGGPLGASAGMLIVSSLALSETAHGHGPFAAQDVTAGMHQLSIFIGVLMSTAFLFAAVLEERREAVQALAQKERSLRAFYDSAPVMMGILELRDDEELYLVSFNRAYAEYKKRPVSELAHRPVPELAATEREQIKGHCRESERTGQAQRFEMVRDTVDGERTFSVVVAFIASQLERHSQFSFVIEDVTEKKEAENALRTAKDAADANARAKSQFLANVTHELRTPLSGIIGMTGLLRTTPLAREQREYVEAVRHSADSLLALVNDLLDYSKIEARKLRMEVEPFPLRRTIGRVMKTLAPQAHEKGLELAYRVSPEVPDAVVGDPGRLRQVLVNLVANAIKFTRSGEVVARVCLDEGAVDDDETATVHFRVSDTGIGIPISQHQSIFGAFSQADGTSTRKHGGTGLGLAISMELVDLMGGRLWVDSEPGKGSTFHFTARLRPHEDAEVGVEESAAASRFEGLRILVVDDSATVREILGAQLRDWGIEPVEAADQAAALAALAAAYREERPIDLLLLDELPGLDVAAFLNRARKIAREAIPSIVVLASGALSRSTDGSPAVSARLAKPIQPSHLRKTMALVLDGHTLESEDIVVTGSHQVPRTSPLRVLLAEDDAVNRAVAVRILENAGHEVRAVENGRQAVAACGEESFDVVLMDVQMPEMDGMEAAKAIRRAGNTQGWSVPIVALTAHLRDEDREACRSAGMDEYITKPVDPDALCELLDRLGTGRALETPGPTPSGTDGAPVFDREALLRRTENDLSLAGELARIFLRECPKTMEGVEKSLSVGDVDEVQRLLHRLTGSMEAVGARSAAVAARRMRDEALGGSLELEPFLEALQVEVRRLTTALTEVAKESALG